MQINNQTYNQLLLLPCPFCNSDAVTRSSYDEKPTDVECTSVSCGASMYDDNDVINKWNTRYYNSDINTNRVLGVLEDLVISLSKAQEDMVSIFHWAYAHDVKYTGHQYGDELLAAKQIIAEYKNKEDIKNDNPR